MNPIEEAEERNYMDRYRILRVNLRTLLSEHKVPSNPCVETTWIIEELLSKIQKKQGTKNNHMVCIYIQQLDYWDSSHNHESSFKTAHTAFRKCLMEILRDYQMIADKVSNDELSDNKIYALISDRLRKRKTV